jgi:(R,R)-butanediol dehydrogenase/meso-butanediol dehydrogenase/diacetyl reductase
MKAAVWHARNDIRVEEAPDPRPPGPDEVIIKVAACGICGTDLEEYRAGPLFIPVGAPNPLSGRMAPLVMGHEFAGEVVEVGGAVRDLRPGDRVAPDTLLYCGRCYWCQRHQVSLCDQLAALGLMADGGLAQLCVAPARMCLRLPNGLAYGHAAMAGPLAVAVRAVRKGRVALGESMAVFGGGTIGLLCLQAARQAGARAVYVVEPHAGRRALARQLGATDALDPTAAPVAEELRRLTGIGPDVVIEASGATAAGPAAIEAARKGGRVVMVGLPVAAASVNFFGLVATEKEIIGSLSHVYDEDYAAAIRLLGEGLIAVEALISDRIPLNDLLPRGLLRLEERPTETLKIIVRPNDDVKRDA